MKALLPMSAARVFFDGIFSTPRLAHPEGVAVHADGSVWCGTETGDLLRIEADGSAATRVGGTGGFLLGIALDAGGDAFCCDLRHQAVFRFEAASGEMRRFAAAGIRVPNYPVIDAARGYLYVSDSQSAASGASVFRFELASGKGGPWCRAPMQFANGMAMAPDGSGLYVVESDAPQVSFVPITSNGSAGVKRLVVPDVQNVPDGLAFAPDGSLIISCYEPSRLYRWREDRGLELLIEDRAATTIAHPTNVAFKGDRLYTANLGRWHITEIDLSTLRA